MGKRRRPFVCEGPDGEMLAHGVLYDDGNVQLFWRKSIQWTAEQHHSIAAVFGIDGITCVRLVDTPPETPCDFRMQITKFTLYPRDAPPPTTHTNPLRCDENA